jgi:arginase
VCDTSAVLIDCFAGIPVDSTGYFEGCERMPAALRAVGLAGTLGVEDLGNLQVSIADPVRDPATGMVGFTSVVGASAVIRGAVDGLLGQGRRPLLIGGCCSVLIGIAAALPTGSGLAFIDGHADFYTGSTAPDGLAADMELAIVVGIGPAALTGMSGGDRLLDPARVVVLGPRDQAEAAEHGAPDPVVAAPGLRQIAFGQIRDRGAAAAGADAASWLAESTGFWIHLDLDVLSTEAMPAVDAPQPAGLDWPELTDLVRPLVMAAGFRGMDVTILNPVKDPDGSCARRIVSWLGQVLA